MLKFEFCLVSSLEKVLPYRKPTALEKPELNLLANERGAFQLAYCCHSDGFADSNQNVFLTIRSDVGSALSCRQVCLVPCDYPCPGTFDEDYLTTIPELLPDLLCPISLQEPFKVIPGQWRSLWFTIDSTGLKAGRYPIELQLSFADGTSAANLSVMLTVRPECLPSLSLYHTEWFHADCLADYYHVPVFSEEHWKIIDHFMAAAARCGVNMLLTPVFTPPLDTARGGERTTVQLVDVTADGGTYHFDFEKLHRWVKLCQKNGIPNFEICHLFTQWGAEAAPKIMVWESGVLMRRFGWDTPATGGDYTRFLQVFLPALQEELSRLGILEHTWFHISDEPNDENKDTYQAAKESVKNLLHGCRIIDALSSFNMYREGIVERPVVSVDHIQPFLDADVPNLWVYYCTCQAVKVPNRFMAMPSARNRILGTLLYVYDIEGFLHWGFNFYNSQYSRTHIDPFRVTDAGEAFPSGDPFLVYPAPDGSAWDSIRSEVLCEAMQDLRLLRLVESHIGRTQTLNLVSKAAGMMPCFDDYPRDAAFFDRLHSLLLAALSFGV